MHHKPRGVVDSNMNEYRVVYWEDNSGEFGKSVRTTFQEEINELAHEGWSVKFSNIVSIPPTNSERGGISAYALLEREIIPQAFRERSKK